MAALAQHFPTLEVLIAGEDNINGKDLLLLLSSAPNLRKLVTIDHGVYPTWPLTGIKAKAFIDLEPSTNLLKAWACEATLKELSINIANIPRLDFKGHRGVVDGEFPGQGWEIQNRVYERIARFTKLETLWLGSNPQHEIRRKEQRDCLEMSLESGLHKLGELKELRELSLAHTKTRVGLKEVQWMTEHWPKLRIIHGMRGEKKEEIGVNSKESEGNEEDEEDEEDARNEYEEIVRWLQDHCPRVQVLGSCVNLADNFDALCAYWLNVLEY